MGRKVHQRQYKTENPTLNFKFVTTSGEQQYQPCDSLPCRLPWNWMRWACCPHAQPL